MRTRKIAGLGLILAVGVVLAGCGSPGTPAGTTVTNPQAATPAGSWLYPNGDPENTRDAAGATISSANVAGLQQAWTFKLPSPLVTSGPGFGSLAATPIATFNTIAPASNGGAETPYGSGGARETPLAGSGGSVTFGTGNAHR